MPDAPLEPEKYGAHGPCDQVSKSVNLSYPTFSKELIHQAAMRLAKQLKPVPSDVRGVRS
jgi:DNA repair protein REV1